MANNRTELPSGLVSRSGSKVTADRTVLPGTIEYRIRQTSAVKGMDVNMQVYELMIIAADDQITLGSTVYKGEYTASEMAGKVGYIFQFTENTSEQYERYDLVRLTAGTFSCSFRPGEVFATMAEWEGLAGITSRQAHRFSVGGKEIPAGTELKPYKRCRQYRPTTVSCAEENARLNKRFEVLGALRKSLSDEGMRKALSVLEAVRRFENMGYDAAYMARKVMLRKLWADYGVNGSSPMEFGRQDFAYAPEIWKRTDRAYVEDLAGCFRQMLADYPQPEWPKTDDVVQFKDRENRPKKYQRSFLVGRIAAFLSPQGNRIEWRAGIYTSKSGVEYVLPGQLEPAETKRKGKKRPSGPKAKPEAAHDGPEPSPSLAERLRMALLEQTRQAA